MRCDSDKIGPIYALRFRQDWANLKDWPNLCAAIQQKYRRLEGICEGKRPLRERPPLFQRRHPAEFFIEV